MLQTESWIEASPGLTSLAEGGDEVGWALATGDFQGGDGRADLAIGVPGDEGDRGAVHVLVRSSSGLTGTDLYLRQERGLLGTLETVTASALR